MATTTVRMNGRQVTVELTRAAEAAMGRLTKPVYVELELYFSCLVKKFVHFRDDSRGKPAVAVTDNLLLYFRPVTSTACTFDLAEKLGRQPEKDIDSEALHHVAPKRVFIDYADGKWQGSYAFL